MVSPVVEAPAPEDTPFSFIPTHQYLFTLAWQARAAGAEAILQLFDATGRVVWRQQRQLQQQIELAVGTLPGGVYFAGADGAGQLGGAAGGEDEEGRQKATVLLDILVLLCIREQCFGVSERTGITNVQ